MDPGILIEQEDVNVRGLPRVLRERESWCTGQAGRLRLVGSGPRTSVFPSSSESQAIPV